jgi:hypothetical protein
MDLGNNFSFVKDVVFGLEQKLETLPQNFQMANVKPRCRSLTILR